MPAPLFSRRLVQQDEWARQQAAANDSDLWVAIGAVLTQFDGLLEGYNARVAAATAVAAEVESSRSGGGRVGDDTADGAVASGTAGSKWGEHKQQVGFGARPTPPRLLRADLLMVSAVGELGGPWCLTYMSRCTLLLERSFCPVGAC